MRQTWEYNRGNWAAIDDQLLNIGGENFEDSIKQAGYVKDTTYGDEGENANCIEIFREKETTVITQRYPFMVFVSLGTDTWEDVFMPDFPSVLMFLKEFGPVIQWQSQSYLLPFFESVLRKAFHVWHGHDTDDACMECDPIEMRVRRMRQEQRRLEKVEAEKRKGNHT